MYDANDKKTDNEIIEDLKYNADDCSWIKILIAVFIFVSIAFDIYFFIKNLQALNDLRPVLNNTFDEIKTKAICSFTLTTIGKLICLAVTSAIINRSKNNSQLFVNYIENQRNKK